MKHGGPKWTKADAATFTSWCSLPERIRAHTPGLRGGLGKAVGLGLETEAAHEML
jgi:hypothetical protein